MPGAKEILAFNDAYYGLYDVSMWTQRQGVTDQDQRRGNAYLGRLQESLATLQKLLPPNHALLRELEEFQDRARTRYERLSQANPAQR